MANVWVDIQTASSFTPYVGGGLGVGRVEASGVNLANTSTIKVTGSSTGLAGQFGFGARWDLAVGSLDIGYRYQITEYDGLSSDTLGAGGIIFDNGKLRAHTLNVGYSFPF